MDDNRRHPERHFKDPALKISLIYSAIGAFWILFSDRVITRLGDQELVTNISILKGWLFVAVTATILHYLIRKYFAQIEASRQQTAASEERFRQLFSMAPVPLCFVDKDGTLVDYNERFVQMFGYS